MLDVIHFIRLVKGSMAALMVVAGGATALAVVSNGQASYTATASELGAIQSTAKRFHAEFPAPSENIHVWWPASIQGLASGWQQRSAAAAATTQTMPFRD
jgi:hypothetical protein